MASPVKQPTEVFVITCGDEGVQINVGGRIGVVGSGLDLPNFPKVVPYLVKALPCPVVIASSEENDWAKEKLDLKDWEQVNATVQQKTEALADTVKLPYAGYLPFTDPQELKHGVKGHMVRPHGVHIANTICFTLAGGEQQFHLGHYLISADWVSDAPLDLVREFMQTQIDFYIKLSKQDKLLFVFEMEGMLGEEKALANKQRLAEIGIE